MMVGSFSDQLEGPIRDITTEPRKLAGARHQVPALGYLPPIFGFSLETNVKSR